MAKKLTINTRNTKVPMGSRKVKGKRVDLINF